MKTKINAIFFAFIMLFALGQTMAQSPDAFNYQAVARDASGNILANQALGIRVSLHNGSSSGTVDYSEIFAPTTNEFGLFTLAIGTGTVISGTFASLDWSSAQYWLQVEMDPTGGVSYTDMGTSQLLSVPYSMYAGQSLWKKNGSNVFYNNGNVGIGTNSPTAKLQVAGFVRFDYVNPMLSFYDGTSYKGFIQSFNDDFIFASTTASGNVEFWTDYAQRAVIDSAGLMGIGTATPLTNLQIGGVGAKTIRIGEFSGDQSLQFYRGDGNYGLSITTSSFGDNYFRMSSDGFATYTDRLVLGGSGNNVLRPGVDNSMSLGNSSYRWTSVYAVNGTINTSDKRDKTNIEELHYGLNEVMKLKPVMFNWKSNPNETKKIGFIAQDVQEVLPNVVTTGSPEIKRSENGVDSTIPADDKLGIYYSDIIPVLVNAIQEQQAQIELLKQEIELLKQK